MEELVSYVTNNQIITVLVVSVISVGLFVMFVGDED